MRQWSVLFGKEMLEMWRNGKWLWVPAVFILLGVMNPVGSYYMPELLKHSGNLPEGTIIQIPMPTGAEVMVKTLSQYGTMGVLILVLSSMGVVAAERSGGMAAMIMVKPVPHFSYISAKWAGLLSLTIVSFFLGGMAAWYYTEVLIGSVSASRVLTGLGIYALWLVFVVSLTLLMSTWLKGGGAIAFVTMLLSAGMSILTGLFSRYAQWSPARLSDLAGGYLTKGSFGNSPGLSIGCTLLLTAALLAGSSALFKRQEVPE